MIHVATWINGRNMTDGLFQEFGVHNQGPKYATFSVWVYVVQGSAGVGIGNEGATSITAVDDTPGRWVQLRGSNLPSQSPVNGMAIYGNSLGLDDFYVDLATVQAASGPSAG